MFTDTCIVMISGRQLPTKRIGQVDRTEGNVEWSGLRRRDAGRAISSNLWPSSDTNFHVRLSRLKTAPLSRGARAQWNGLKSVSVPTRSTGYSLQANEQKRQRWGTSSRDRWGTSSRERWDTSSSDTSGALAAETRGALAAKTQVGH